MAGTGAEQAGARPQPKAIRYYRNPMGLPDTSPVPKKDSMGMDYVELAHFFKQLGCTDAINLDGGGSTTFWLDGKIMNSPSDKHERAVANCLFIVEHSSSLPASDSQSGH